MPRKYSIVIADTSCFILLNKIDQFELLREVFGEIATTKEIADEFNEPLPDWIKIRSAKNLKYHQLLEIEIDKGEASAIALALEDEDSLLILDDAKARKLAGTLNLNFTGTLGLFLKAKELGIISSLKPLLEKIQKTNFRFSEKILNDILREADE